MQEDDKPFKITLGSDVFETYEIDTPSHEMEITKKELGQMYFDMTSMRYGSQCVIFPGGI